MSQFAVICPRCGAELVIPARRLLAHVEQLDAGSGEAVFTCLWCHRTGVTTVDGEALAAVREAGVTTLALASQRNRGRTSSR
jgi:hypothetical protein